jgi:hypothetical protein
MYWKFLLAIAASLFLAFASLTPDDLLATRSAGTAEYVPLDEAGPVDGPEESLDRSESDAVETALNRIGSRVVAQSHQDALRSAFRAYYNYRAANPEQVRKPYLYFVDFGFDSDTPRGYVFDMDALSIVEGPFPVAHGRGSVQAGSKLPTRFLNTKGSNASSLGLYVAQETYAFSGKSGGRAYRSVGLRLNGVSGKYNSAARERGIVVHGAPYVTANGAGRSEGCPAMEMDLAQDLIPRIANGGMVFLFSPNDPTWLKYDPWAGGPAPTVARLGTGIVRPEAASREASVHRSLADRSLQGR